MSTAFERCRKGSAPRASAIGSTWLQSACAIAAHLGMDSGRTLDQYRRMQTRLIDRLGTRRRGAFTVETSARGTACRSAEPHAAVSLQCRAQRDQVAGAHAPSPLDARDLKRGLAVPISVLQFRDSCMAVSISPATEWSGNCYNSPVRGCVSIMWLPRKSSRSIASTVRTKRGSCVSAGRSRAARARWW